MSKEKPTDPQSWRSETSKPLRRRFWIGLGVYVLGFLVLASIGDAINQDGYMLRGFLAPFLTFGAVAFIVWNFVFTD